MKKSYFFHKFALFLFLICGIMTTKAQNLTVEQAQLTTGWTKTLINGETVAFPAAANTPSSFSFKLKNSGATVIQLTGNPVIQISGANASEFTATQPAMTTLNPGNTATFDVTYTPTGSGLSQAQLQILSDDAASPFSINLSGAAFDLYGPAYPVPTGTITVDNTAATNGSFGRTGGGNIRISGVSFGEQTDLYWGPRLTSDGDLGYKVSMNDDGIYQNQENLTFNSALSNLAAGKLVWTGNTTIQSAITGSFTPVMIRATMTATWFNGFTFTPVTLIDPATLGLSSQIGGLVQFDELTDYLQANFLIEASSNGGVTWTPYLNFYDSYPTPPGPLPGAGIGKAYSSVNNGFYWKNTDPSLTQNQTLNVDEGGTATITTSVLNATDLEDLLIGYRTAADIVFEIVTTNGLATSFNTGILELNGTQLVQGSNFTLQDLIDGNLSFTHDGSETTYDEILLSFRDSKGLLGIEGIYTVYNFKININPVDDTPVASDLNFTSSYAAPLNESLVASDDDSTVLTFMIVSGPTNGTISSFDPATGSFTYTPGLGAPGTDSFTYNVTDGNSTSAEATVTINLINLPPDSADTNFKTIEDTSYSGTLSATDPEGTAVTFGVTTPSGHGSLNLNSDGNFTYTPNTSYFGYDSFQFNVTDGEGNSSSSYSVIINIIPRIDPGDILVVDKTNIRLYDPVMAQDTIITQNQGLEDALNTVYKKNVGLFAYDINNGLIKVDPLTGDQTLVAAASNFTSAPPIGGPAGMFINYSNNILMADASGILEVNPSSGLVTTLYSGGNLEYPTGIAMLSNGDLLISDAGMISSGSSKIIKIATDGTQSVISTGGYITLPLDIAVLDENRVVVSDAGSFIGGSDNIYLIDLGTGNQTLLSTGGNISIPSNLDVWQNNVFVVNKMGNMDVLKIDSTTGTQSIVAGSPLTNPWGLFIVQNPVSIYDFSTQQTSCPDASDGSFTFNISGGTSPYTYQLNGGNVENVTSLPFTIPSLGVGSYSLAVTDDEGETASLTFTISSIPDTENPTITAPADITASTDTDSCEAVLASLGTPVADDNCTVASITNDAPASFAVGTTVVTWTATDSSGNTSTATQNIIITDDQQPVISAPADFAVSTDTGSCEATIADLGTETASDNCTIASITNDAPAVFPIGETIVTWTITDAAGNTSTAVQKITVTDNELPVISAPADLTVDPDNGVCYASGVNLGSPVVSDNCTIQSVTNDAPATFPQGTTTITWTVTDAAGNTATATQQLTVNEIAAPVLPVSQTLCEGALISDLDTNGYTVNWYVAMNDVVPVSGNTRLTSGTYYAAQSLGNCESPSRVSVNVTINITPAPTGNSTQSFCEGATIMDISASGNGIIWYDSLNSQIPLTSDTALVNGKHYYASQTNAVTGCESIERLDVIVTVNSVATPSGETFYTFCIENQPTLGDISGNYTNTNWYSDSSRNNMISETSPLYDGQIIYGAGYNAATGCESLDLLAVEIRVIDCKVEIFNYITPNNNNRNENLVITNIEQFPDNRLQVYNRQGKLVYEVIGYGQNNKVFNGRSNFGSDKLLPTGTYFYVITYYSTITGNYESKKGFLYLNNNE